MDDLKKIVKEIERKVNDCFESDVDIYECNSYYKTSSFEIQDVGEFDWDNTLGLDAEVNIEHGGRWLDYEDDGPEFDYEQHIKEVILRVSDGNTGEYVAQTEWMNFEYLRYLADKGEQPKFYKIESNERD